MDSEGQAREVSDGDKDSIGNYNTLHSCYIVAKNLFILCPYSETLSEVELKHNEVNNVRRKFPR
jgi:hypothetical protein